MRTRSDEEAHEASMRVADGVAAEAAAESAAAEDNVKTPTAKGASNHESAASVALAAGAKPVLLST